MATVTEYVDSRIGLSEGLHGSQNYTTMWTVTVDAVGDNPITALQTASGGVPIGTPHPWNSAITCQNYQLIEYLNGQLTYRVLAIYGPPLVVDGLVSDKWEILYDFSLDSERAMFDLNGVGIGPIEYAPVEETSGIPLYTTQTARGPQKLTANYSAVVVTGRGGSAFDGSQYATVPEPVRKSVPRRLIGAERTRKRGGATLVKVMGRQPSSALASFAAIYHNRINNDSVVVPTLDGLIKLGEKGTLKAARCRARAVNGFQLGQTVPNRLWQIELELEAIDSLASTAWQVHEYIDEAGVASPIFFNGARVEESFGLYRTASFGSMLAVFN